MARKHLDDDVRDVLLALHAAGHVAPAEEYRWHPTRRWRFDFAWLHYRLAAEVEGGTFVAGRHSRGRGYEQDCEKYNAACLLGWTVLRFTEGMVRGGAMFSALDLALGNCRQFGRPEWTSAPSDPLAVLR